MRALSITMFLCTALSVAAGASAQDRRPRAQRAQPAADTDPDLARARERYAEGLAALDDQRWADALGAFRESYALSHAPPALFNTALVLRGLGRMIEARDTLASLLTLLPEGEATLRDVAAVMRAEAASRIAVLELEGLPAPGRVRIRFDGEAVEDGGARPLRLEADPGRHAVIVVAPGAEPFEWGGDLRDGARESIAVVLAPPDDPVLWPWIAAGSGAVAVGIFLAVLLASSGDEQDYFQVGHPSVVPPP